MSLWPTRRVHEDPSHQHPIHESDISHIVEPTSNISPHHYPHPPIGEQAQVQAPLSHQSDIAKKCLKELRRPTRFRTRLSFAQSSRQIRTSAAQRFDPDDIEGNFARLSENPENVPCRHSAVTLFKPNSPPTARCRSKRKDLFEALGPVGALSEEENIPDEGVVSNLDSEFDIPASAAAAGVGASPAPPSPSPTAAAAARAKAFTGAVEAPLEEENIPNEEFASDLHSDFETAPSSFGVSPPSSPIPADTVAAATAAQASTNIIGSLIAPAVLAVPVTSAVLASSPAASIIVSSPVASTPDHLSGNLPSASFPPGQHTVTSVPSGLPASTRTSLVQTAGASTSIDKAASISSTDNHSGTPRLAQSTTGNTSIDHNTHTPHPAQSTSGDTSIYRHTDTPLPAQSATGVTSTEQALSFSSPDHHRGSPRLAQGTTEDTSINHHTVTATQIAASTATSTSNDQNFALTNSSSSSAAPLATGSSPKPKWPKRRRSSHTTPVPRKRQRTTYFIPPTREGAFVLSPVAEETASAVKKANLDTISEPDNFGYQGEDTPAERRAYSEPPEFDPMDLDDESYRASFAPLAESPSGGSQEPYGARHPLAAPKPRRKGKGAGDATYTPAGSNTGAQLSGDESDYDILVPESEKKGLAFDFAQEKARRLAQADHHTDDFWSHAEQDLHARISMRGYEALLPEHWQFDFRTLPDSLFGKADDGEPLIRATGGSELHGMSSFPY